VPGSARRGRRKVLPRAVGELHAEREEERPAGLPYVWTYRDHSLEKDWRFPFKLSRSGPEKSKRIIAMDGIESLSPDQPIQPCTYLTACK
jgi:hypothetical protein